MTVQPIRWLAVGFALVASAGPAVAQKQDAFEPRFRKFAEQHCVSCHGPEVQRRQLRLDKLPATFEERATAETWVKVLDRVARGEMPPRNRPRPAEKDTGAILDGLRKELHSASLAKQQREGRVILRRLNRTEYETTLRDLLGTAVEVRELLPDDNVAAGFDNVSAVLDVSPAHLLRYQDAAEKALQTVIPSRPLAEFKDRRTGRQITEKMIHFRDVLGKVGRLDGDTLILYARPYSHIPCATAGVPQTGRYRVRASVHAVGTAGKVLPVRCVVDDVYGRDETNVQAVFDVPEGKGRVIEVELDVKARQAVVFAGWSSPTMREFGQKRLEDYTGPGLAVQWVEIEGPLDPWPPTGYSRLFAGVPLEPTSVARAKAEGRPVPPQPIKRSWDSYIYDPLVPSPAKPREDAERLMRAFLPLAFRRPVPVELQDYYVKMVLTALDRKMPFTEALLLGYKAALCSPHFLFLTETVDPARKERPTVLDQYALASRLSYFLWSSMPDAELLQKAAKGELTKPEVLRAQTERLLNDARAQRFTANFAGQWLDLRQINATSPDPQIYGEFDHFLFW